jgi:thiol:disulfide interchange protein
VVRKAIAEKGVVTLRADKTTANPEADTLQKLLGLESQGLPILAVFCGSNPTHPQVLTDVYGKQDVLRVLETCSATDSAPAKLETAQAR